MARKARPSSAPELRLSIQYPAGKDHAPTRSHVRKWVHAACDAAISEAEIAVRFVDEIEGRALNADYRHKDYATNVLSFPYQHGNVLIGDLVICVPVVLKEAMQQGKSGDAHFAHLVVHGMLHLQSYDHETSAEDAEQMEMMERRILAELGYSDPYGDTR